MNSYLTIGEFAKLRNVDRKSLRYYERIGALIPAYTDPATQYRYYKLEQLVDLDTILMCLELEIPLKEAAQYKNKDGSLDILRLYNDGKQKANEKLTHLYTIIGRLEGAICSMKENEQYKNKSTFYRRYKKKRSIIRTPFSDLGNEIAFRQKATDLFVKAQQHGYIPMFNFPVGIMAEHSNKTLKIYVTLEIFSYEYSDSTLELFSLPEGDYLCYQENCASIYNPSSYCLDIFAENPEIHFIFLTNMTLDKYEENNFPLEIQAFISDQ